MTTDATNPPEGRYAELAQKAIEALSTSHPNQPERLQFGAAVLTRSGAVYAASVFWSATGTLSLHAEHAALSHAACHGERDVVAVACASTEDPAGVLPCHPCGICKQLIYESAMISKIDIDVVMASRNGDVVVKKISELVPYPWPA